MMDHINLQENQRQHKEIPKAKCDKKVTIQTLPTKNTRNITVLYLFLIPFFQFYAGVLSFEWC